MLKSSIIPMALSKTRSTSASLRCSGVRADRSAISSDIRAVLPFRPFGHIIDTLASSHEDPPLAAPLNIGGFTFHSLRQIDAWDLASPPSYPQRSWPHRARQGRIRPSVHLKDPEVSPSLARSLTVGLV